MSAGLYIAGIVMTILSMVSFQTGGAWMLSGLICGVVTIGIAIQFFIDDNKIKVNNKMKGGI